MNDRRRTGELPPYERYQHDPIEDSTRAVTDENGRVSGYVHGAKVITTCVIDRLLKRGLLAQPYWVAGKRLYRDFFAAGLSPQITMRFKDYISGAGAPLASDRQLEARKSFNDAMRAIGSELNDLLFDVVCADKTLGECELMRRWRPTTALAVLTIALGQLCEHYDREQKA